MKIINGLFTVLGVALAGGSLGAAPASDAASPAASALGEVKFAFDSSALSDDAQQALSGVVQFASEHPDQRIVLDAHCDPIGSQAYNAGLAVRRAESVRAQLTRAGVSEDQIVLAIYGEAGARRASYADDRRVTLWPTRQPLAAVIDHTLASAGTAVTWNKPLTTAQVEATPEPVATR
jgi:peptidoglycan-associated lipoprotein